MEINDTKAGKWFIEKLNRFWKIAIIFIALSFGFNFFNQCSTTIKDLSQFFLPNPKPNDPLIIIIYNKDTIGIINDMFISQDSVIIYKPELLQSPETNSLKIQEVQVVLPKSNPPKQLKDYEFAPTMILIKGGKLDLDQGVFASISTFFIGKYEVTFNEYISFVNEIGRDEPYDDGFGKEERPVINITRQEAEEYTQWLSKKTNKKYRLPTINEWKYIANFDKDKIQRLNENKTNAIQNTTIIVTQTEKNTLGIFGLHSNVSEWTSDEDGNPSYPAYIGGSYINERKQNNPYSISSGNSMSSVVGFRVVREIN